MKVSKEQWLELGLRLLIKKGPSEIKIDRLCQAAKISKGSFYHHFKNRDEYVNSLLAFWREQNTQSIIAETEKVQSYDQKSQVLDSLTIGIETGTEKAIRNWAQYEAAVKRVVKKVDNERIGYLEKIISAVVGPNGNANLIAKTAYAHYVGAQQLNEVISQQEWQDMNQMLREMLLANPGK